MVFLGLGTTWGCTRWLHREDFVFELSDKKSDEAGESKKVKFTRTIQALYQLGQVSQCAKAAIDIQYAYRPS